MPILIGGAVVVIIAIVLLIVLFKACWKVPEPNQALLLSGRHHKNVDPGAQDFGFRIVIGRGVLVIPGVQVVRRLNLDLKEADLNVDCVTNQGIPVNVRGVVIFKVGDDYTSIANAARRFLDQEGQMEPRVHNVFAGHLRSIVGGLTIEDMIRDRAKMTSETRDSSGNEMEKLGLVIDSLQIHEIDDPTGYIENLAKPHTAAVASQARIAAADQDRQAAQAEQQANALKAEAVRDSQIKQSAYQADVDKAQAEAAQSGPLAQAAAQQQVVVEQTKAAQLQADLAEQQLQATVRKPADAEAYKQVTLATALRDAAIVGAEADKRRVELAAEADAQRVKLTAEAQATATKQTGEAEAAATQARGLAEAESAKAKGLAEAASIDARAKALAENQDAVIGQQLAEHAADIVSAAAGAFNGVDNMIVLNGAEGVTSSLASIASQAGTILSALRQSMHTGGVPVVPVPKPAAVEAPVEVGKVN